MQNAGVPIGTDARGQAHGVALNGYCCGTGIVM